MLRFNDVLRIQMQLYANALDAHADSVFVRHFYPEMADAYHEEAAQMRRQAEEL